MQKNKRIQAALSIWNDASETDVIKMYLNSIEIPKKVYHKYVGKQLKGHKLRFKENGEYSKKYVLLYMLGQSCIVKTPLDPDLLKKRGRLLQGIIEPHDTCYLGPESSVLGIVQDLEAALSLLTLDEFKLIKFAVTASRNQFQRYQLTGDFERIIVFADDDFQSKNPDNPSLQSALKLLRRLRKETKAEVMLCRPKRLEKVMRWNDLLRQGLLSQSIEWGADVELVSSGPDISSQIEELNHREYGSIVIKDGVFWTHNSQGGLTTLSNFMILPEATILNPNGNETLDCMLVHAEGHTKKIQFNLEDLNEQSKFALKCKTKRPWGYIWSGKSHNFSSLLLFLNSVSRNKPTIRKVNYWGCFGGKAFFYDNTAISKSETVEMEGSKIRIAGEEYLLERTLDNPYGKAVRVLLNQGITADVKVEKVFKEIKGSGEAALALGFGIATMYLEHVIERFGAFPFLFLFGYRQTAKTTLARLVMSLFGFQLSLPPVRFKDSTEVGIAQGMEALGCIPYWIDEYNDSSISRISPEFIKNLYNQSGAAIGSLEGAKNRGVKTSFLLSGQVISVDSAIRTRSITVRMTLNELNKNVIRWSFDNWHLFGVYDAEKIKQSLNVKNQKAYLEKTRELMDEIAREGIDYRLALNHAVSLAAIDLFTGIDAVPLKRLTLSMLKEFEEELEELEPVNAFFNEILNLFSQNSKEANETILKCIDVSKKKDAIHIRLSVLHSLLSQRKIPVDTKSSLQINLKTEYSATKGQLKIGKEFYKGVFSIPVKQASDEMKLVVAEILGKPDLFKKKKPKPKLPNNPTPPHLTVV